MQRRLKSRKFARVAYHRKEVVLQSVQRGQRFHDPHIKSESFRQRAEVYFEVLLPDTNLAGPALALLASHSSLPLFFLPPPLLSFFLFLSLTFFLFFIFFGVF